MSICEDEAFVSCFRLVATLFLQLKVWATYLNNIDVQVLIEYPFFIFLLEKLQYELKKNYNE